MTTIKAYTDLEQSKKLAEFLPLESADMGLFYSRNPNAARNQMWVGTKAKNADIPCWSLAALTSIIPQELFGGEYIINITEGLKHKWIISYESRYEVSSYIDASSDNLIDCCVEMIIKLKERNLL